MKRHFPFLLLLASALPAMAHPATYHAMNASEAAQAGFFHPLSGLDHLLVMVAVGLWAVRLGGRALWMLPCAFVLPMILGGVAGMGALPQPMIEHGITASLLLLGAALGMAWKPSLPLALGVVALCGTCHGFAHGSEMPAGSMPLLFLAAMTVATSLLHAGGIAAGLSCEGKRLEPAFRIAGLILIAFPLIAIVAR
jgi:urease accessory protein